MQFGSRYIDLQIPRVMGVLNVTPDSFSDGGNFWRENGDLSPAITQAERMVTAGASFIDVGGESTRPGAQPVTLQEELDRVLPVVEAITQRLDVVVSVDTSSAELMTSAASVGAGLINDVRALQREGALTSAANTNLPVCLMHMQGMPQSMQENPHYSDVVNEVANFLSARIDAAKEAGIAEDKIILDPGFGFGKTDAHNLALMKGLQSLRNFRQEKRSFPLLVGVSRKSMIGRLLNREVHERLAGSLALAHHALTQGAAILRVHDVAETVDLIKIFTLLNQQE